MIVDRHGITIPSVFVAGSTGMMLGQFNKRLKYALISLLGDSCNLVCSCLQHILLVFSRFDHSISILLWLQLSPSYLCMSDFPLSLVELMCEWIHW